MLQWCSSINFIMERNQEDNVQFLHEQNCAIKGGIFEEFKQENFVSQIREILAPDRFDAMQAKSQKTILGEGALYFWESIRAEFYL